MTFSKIIYNMNNKFSTFWEEFETSEKNSQDFLEKISRFLKKNLRLLWELFFLYIFDKSSRHFLRRRILTWSFAWRSVCAWRHNSDDKQNHDGKQESFMRKWQVWALNGPASCLTASMSGLLPAGASEQTRGWPDDGDLEVLLGQLLPGSVQELPAPQKGLTAGVLVRLVTGAGQLLAVVLGVGLDLQGVFGHQETQRHGRGGGNPVDEFGFHPLKKVSNKEGKSVDCSCVADFISTVSVCRYAQNRTIEFLLMAFVFISGSKRFCSHQNAVRRAKTTVFWQGMNHVWGCAVSEGSGRGQIQPFSSLIGCSEHNPEGPQQTRWCLHGL